MTTEAFMATYIHDTSGPILYEIPDPPVISERRNSKGKRTDWVVSMKILITRPDNVLVAGRWKHPLFTTFQEHYDPRDSRDQVLSFFLTANLPTGTHISKDEFAALKHTYETHAKNNSSTTQTGAEKQS